MRYLAEEELQIASKFVFLSMAITVLEQDLSYIKQGSFKIKEPYIHLIERMIFTAFENRKKLRKDMYDRDLTVSRTRKDDLFTTYLFICKRREEERTYFNPVIRKNVKEIILDLLENVLLQNKHLSNLAERNDGDGDVDWHMKA